jgi:hypothetical protein
MAVRTALDRRLMQPADLALVRAVSSRMTVHAARMGQHLAELAEIRGRALLGVGDRRKTLRRRQHVLRGCGARGEAEYQRGDQAGSL